MQEGRGEEKGRPLRKKKKKNRFSRKKEEISKLFKIWTQIVINE